MRLKPHKETPKDQKTVDPSAGTYYNGCVLMKINFPDFTDPDNE